MAVAAGPAIRATIKNAEMASVTSSESSFAATA
eukprot:CAMPEP_0197698452 /NCGR_PEP_ID=MMETSP1338-20131121/119367_1 /TAXON_ID=43686 ORGANISM="Pelagodinium beii, Strain RCC1491" /NCGR_SAMPLE_ID=MMETSP1338 /ASSEMBLY_ACC=CAM_ASM_000754 /LENGTH=32 /DNA_ID= /DNA_START= /DNA_END= /DNA_ORIENTATION=